MPERIVQPDTDSTHEPDETTRENRTSNPEAAQPRAASSSGVAIIWTPRFILIFAITLVLGLCLESVLTQGWMDSYYPGPAILLALVVLICALWLALIVLTHSWKLRIGGMFGCLWAIFVSIDLVISLRPIDPTSPILGHLSTAILVALLGTYIFLSMNGTPFHRWDALFFSLAFVIGSCAVVVIYFLTPAINRSPGIIENSIGATALFLSLLVWWMRPSSWKAQPGPTFLFGIVPFILLLLSIPNGATRDTNFFFTQVAYLCIILGAMRILQGELRS